MSDLHIGVAGHTTGQQLPMSSPDPDWVQAAWASYLQGAMAAQADAQAAVSEAALVAALPTALPNAAVAAPAATTLAAQPNATPVADAAALRTVSMSSQVGNLSFQSRSRLDYSGKS